jgi:hypothetical protein
MVTGFIELPDATPWFFEIFYHLIDKENRSQPGSV